MSEKCNYSKLSIAGQVSSRCFQMFTVFSGRHVGVSWKQKHGGSILASNWTLTFVQNISTNQYLKFGKTHRPKP